VLIDNKHTKTYIRPMAQMNISIPDKLKAWVESRVAEGDYASSSDYLRDLVRQDQRERMALERLRAEIQEGFDSPESDLDPFEHIAELRRGLKAMTDRKDAA
jgi:antitoxin ParD1/3/4